MGNPFSVQTNLKGDIPDIQFGRRTSLEESYETNLWVYGNIAANQAKVNQELNNLDVAGLIETIESEIAEAEEEVNEKSTAEKISQWTNLATAGLGMLNAFSSTKAMNGVTSSVSAAAQSEYTKLSDEQLTEKLNEARQKKSDAEAVIKQDGETVQAQITQQKIVDSYNDGTHEECVKLQSLKDSVKTLEIPNGGDPLVTTYNETSAALAEANKGENGSLAECNDLRLAKSQLESAKTTKIYKAGENGAQVEDTIAMQDAIGEAQAAVDKAQLALDQKKKELELKQEADLKAINQEKASREEAVRQQEQTIATNRKGAIDENNRLLNEIETGKSDVRTANTTITAITQEQTRRSSASKTTKK